MFVFIYISKYIRLQSTAKTAHNPYEIASYQICQAAREYRCWFFH